jgi:hypothetical protein
VSFSREAKNANWISCLVDYFHPPLQAGLQPAIQIRKQLPSGDGSFFPSGGLVRKIRADFVGKMPFPVLDVEKIARHFKQTSSTLR